MPKVTLLAEAWQDRTIPFGKRTYVFKGGIPLTVPTAVALFCQGKVSSDGSDLFQVEDLDNIVVPAPELIVPEKQNVEKETSVLGNFTQLRLIEAELCH